MTAQITVEGITYNVLREHEFLPERFPGRYAITIQRPKGKRLYEVVRYANGSYSSVAGPF